MTFNGDTFVTFLTNNHIMEKYNLLLRLTFFEIMSVEMRDMIYQTIFILILK
jgi:hypothetical protein